MELLHMDDPRRIGPFPTLGVLDDAASGARVRERRFVARSASGDRTLIVTTPHDEARSDEAGLARFRSEAEQAHRLSVEIPGLLPVVEISPSGEERPWHASPFVPTLSLPDALSAYGGPLPLRTVLVVGCVLAETLTHLHGRGFAHAGITPWAVFLSALGPRLTSFGAVRSAAPDGEDRSGLPGMVSESVPPEQLTGGRPRPLGDVYSLGAVLSYAATGHMVAENEELPSELQSLVPACLARDPARRPQASAVLDELMNSSAQWAQRERDKPSTVTVLDGEARRAGSLLSPGWIPKRVCVALGAQAEQVLAAETDPQLLVPPLELDQVTDFRAETATGEQGATPPRELVGAGNAGGATAPSWKATLPPSSTSRRNVMTTAASGAVGIAIGGAVTWMATSDEIPPPTLAQRLAARKTQRKRPQGAPPAPRWRYEIPGAAPKYAPLIATSRIAVVANGSSVHGVELRSGKQVWQSRLRTSGPLRLVDGDSVLVPAEDVIALNARTGAVRWRSKKFRREGSSPYASVLAVEGGTAWFTVRERGTGSGSGWSLVAYDVAKSSELWRRQAPAGVTEGHLSKDLLVVAAAEKSSPDGEGGGSAELVAFDRRTGDVRWRREHEGTAAGSMVALFGDGRLVAADGHVLRGYAMEKSDEPEWRLQTGGKNGEQRPRFGAPLVHGESAFVTDVSHAVHSVDTEGRVKWRSSLERAWEAADRPPDTLVTPDGQMVLSLDEAEVIARDARSGSVRWRFLDTPGGAGGAAGWRRAAATDDLAVVVSRNSAYALPLS